MTGIPVDAGSQHTGPLLAASNMLTRSKYRRRLPMHVFGSRHRSVPFDAAESLRIFCSFHALMHSEAHLPRVNNRPLTKSDSTLESFYLRYI